MDKLKEEESHAEKKGARVPVESSQVQEQFKQPRQQNTTRNEQAREAASEAFIAIEA